MGFGILNVGFCLPGRIVDIFPGREKSLRLTRWGVAFRLGWVLFLVWVGGFGLYNVVVRL